MAGYDGRRTARNELLRRYECLLRLVHGQQVRGQLAGHGKGRTVAVVSPLESGLVYVAQVTVLGRREFGRLDQDGLQVRIAFLG